MKENLCTKYFSFTYNDIALNKKPPITKENLHIFFYYRQSWVYLMEVDMATELGANPRVMSMGRWGCSSIHEVICTEACGRVLDAVVGVDQCSNATLLVWFGLRGVVFPAYQSEQNWISHIGCLFEDGTD